MTSEIDGLADVLAKKRKSDEQLLIIAPAGTPGAGKTDMSAIASRIWRKERKRKMFVWSEPVGPMEATDR